MSMIDYVQKHKIVSLIAIIIIFQVIGGLIGWVTASGINGWYQGLAKSSLTPPDYIFGVVWTTLYALLAFSFWKIIISEDAPNKPLILKAFGGHMVLNWLWSPLFFIAQSMIASFVLIIVILITAILLARYIYSFKKVAALPFIPYIGWLSLACYLSFYIARYN